MADALSGDIRAAVAQATGTGTTPSGRTGPAAEPTPAPAATSPPATPARGSGIEPTPSTPRSTDAPTTRASEPEAAPSGSTDAAPPETRWATILENARTKARQDAEQQVRAIYGLSPQMDAGQVRAHLSQLATDPVAYHRALTESLRAQGLLGQPTQPVTRPSPDLRSEDGRAAYSAEALEQLLAWQQAQLDQRLSHVLAPLQETQQTLAVERTRQQAWSQAKAEYEDAKTWDGFEELRPQIHELMAADKRVTLWSAYNRLHQSWLKDRDERVRREARQATLAELQARPNPTTVTPGQSRPSTAARKGRGLDADLDDAISQAMSKLGAA